MLIVTPNAEKAISRFIRGSDTPIAGLRIAVTGGGCSGLQYAMDLVEERRPDDVEVACGEITVFVEPLSAPLLRGVTLDFVDGIDGSGFKFDNPNANHSCGCGNSFSA